MTSLTRTNQRGMLTEVAFLWLRVQERRIFFSHSRGASDPRAKDKKTSEKDKEKEKRSDTLTSEAILQKGPLLFWKRYYAHDSDISKMTNTFLLNIYFVQTLKQILSGMFPLGRVDAKNFGALQLQVPRSDDD